MKTKFALLFLPALMALSSCGAAAKPVAEKVFLEDTTAQSEIFGNRDVVGGKLGIKNRAKGEAIAEPDIGYQIRYADGKIAIRFVAAIKDLNVKAYWRRGVAGADGTELQSKSFANDGREVTNYYTSLSDGNTTITAGAEGKYADYVGFVVYSIYNIPYETYKDAYVAAYVNLVGDEDGDSSVHNNSKALAVKIEKKTNYVSNNVFTFNPTMNKHFLEGTINGVVYDGGEHGLYEESANKPDGNHAWYENITLSKTDSFGSFYYDHDRTFLFFGNSSFSSESVNFLQEASLSEFNKPIKDGIYHLYISSGSGEPLEHENCVYTNVVYFNEEVNVWLNPSSDWKSDGARFATYFFGHVSSDPVWRDMVVDGDYYKVAIPAGYPSLIFGRMNPGTTDNNFNDGVRWNQGPNINLTSMTAGVSCRYDMENGWGGSGSFVVHP